MDFESSKNMSQYYRKKGGHMYVRPRIKSKWRTEEAKTRLSDQNLDIWPWPHYNQLQLALLLIQIIFYYR